DLALRTARAALAELPDGARGPVGEERVGAGPRGVAGVGRAAVAVVGAGRGGARVRGAAAGAGRAHVVLRAGVAVVARRAVGAVGPRRRRGRRRAHEAGVARVHRAGGVERAGDEAVAEAAPGAAHLAGRARGAVGEGRVGAGAAAVAL